MLKTTIVMTDDLCESCDERVAYYRVYEMFEHRMTVTEYCEDCDRERIALANLSI